MMNVGDAARSIAFAELFSLFALPREQIIPTHVANDLKDLHFPLQLSLEWFRSSTSLDTRIPMLRNGSVSRMK